MVSLFLSLGAVLGLEGSWGYKGARVDLKMAIM